MQEFKQLLAEMEIENPQNIRKLALPLENTTQAFSQSQEQFSDTYSFIDIVERSSNRVKPPPQLVEIKIILEEVLTGKKDAWEYFERLDTQSQYFSLQISKQNPRILVASSTSPLSVISDNHQLLHNEQIVRQVYGYFHLETTPKF